MASRCFSPPDSRWPRSPTSVSSPAGSDGDQVVDPGGPHGLGHLGVRGTGRA